MSRRMCPSSSSHQHVAAAFRRARKKFPTNFGQLSWPVPRDLRNDNGKSEPVSSLTTMTVCGNCKEIFPCDRKIRNSRSNNVWPSFTNSCKTPDPRITRSSRENNNDASSTPNNFNDGSTTRNRDVCSCGRRICKSWKKRNFAVSWGESNERFNQEPRKCGGDGGERSSIETISRKSCRSGLTTKTRDCHCDIENKTKQDSNVRETSETRKKSKNKGRERSDSYDRNDGIRDFEKIDDLDLLYDHRVNGTREELAFSSNGGESETNVSHEEDVDFPGKLNEWENRIHSFESKTRRGSMINRRYERTVVVKHCDCVGKGNNGRVVAVRGETSLAENQCPREWVHGQRERSLNIFLTFLGPNFFVASWNQRSNLRMKNSAVGNSPISKVPDQTRRSCSLSVNHERLCKDCSSLRRCCCCCCCWRNNSSILVSSIRDETSLRQHQRNKERDDCSARNNDVESSCAIKHKDSMAILVEKFKNKKINCPSDDETTEIFKSDEDSSKNEGTTRIIKEKINHESCTDENDKDAEKSISGSRKFCKHCCTAREN